MESEPTAFAEPTAPADHSGVAAPASPRKPPSRVASKVKKKRKYTALVDEDQAANSWKLWSRGLDWPTVIWIAAVHVIALAAPFYFSWQSLVVCGVLILATGSLGVCMGYHRLLTHNSFKTYKPIRWLLAFLGGLSGEGSALTWVANHRKHHAFSDKEGDPHSPRHGKWWSHITWFMPNRGMKWHDELLAKYAPDMMKDRVMIILHKMFLPTHLIVGAGLFLLGYFGQWMGLEGGSASGFSMLAWGTGVRMFYVFHATWFVNSISHMWGYRNYETTDDSRNNPLVGLLAFGEGWHNNHHAFQRVASQGHKWWEFDPTYWVILAMEKVGLAWDVVRLKDLPRNARPA